jgi:hypothetical protein
VTAFGRWANGCLFMVMFVGGGLMALDNSFVEEMIE